MKKLFTILALCITVLTTSMASFADPPFDRGHTRKVLKADLVVNGMIVGINLTVTIMVIVFAMNAVCVRNVALSV